MPPIATGAPSAAWAHLSSWKDRCQHYPENRSMISRSRISMPLRSGNLPQTRKGSRGKTRQRCGQVSFPIDAVGHGGLVVRAVFTLADGTNLRGYLSPPPVSLRRPGYLQPVIICDAGQVNSWHGIQRPTQNQMTDELAKLGKQVAEVFPLRYLSDVPLVGGPISGIIPGLRFHREQSRHVHWPRWHRVRMETCNTNSRE